jgi:hypothetical protein
MLLFQNHSKLFFLKRSKPLRLLFLANIALLGNEALLPAKAYLTPAKFLLFYAASIVAIGNLSISLGLRILKKFTQ